MNKLNECLTLIATISVVLGIIFLAVELQQNTEAIGEKLWACLGFARCGRKSEWVSPPASEPRSTASWLRWMGSSETNRADGPLIARSAPGHCVGVSLVGASA